MSTKVATEVVAWHFAGKTLRDGSPLPKKGDTLRFAGEVVACPKEDDLARRAGGYHGSERALDALRYAPGAMVALVRLSGTVVAHGYTVDKHAASERTNLTDYVDASRVLHEFACACATAALDREDAAGRPVDPRSRNAIEVKLRWLAGTATDADLAAASDAARAAARAAQNIDMERRLRELLEVTP